MTDGVDAVVYAMARTLGPLLPPPPHTPGGDWLTELFLRPRCAACGYRSKTSRAGRKAKGLCVWCVARFMELEEQGVFR